MSPRRSRRRARATRAARVGRIKADCRSKRTDDANGGRQGRRDGNMVLSVGEGKGSKGSRAVMNYMAMAIDDGGGTGLMRY